MLVTRMVRLANKLGFALEFGACSIQVVDTWVAGQPVVYTGDMEHVLVYLEKAYAVWLRDSGYIPCSQMPVFPEDIGWTWRCADVQ